MPKGRVIRTEPGAGSTQPEGSTITIVVSSGPEPTEVTVPNVVGLSEENATAVLEGKGLVVEVNEFPALDESQDGKVMSQNPPAGSKVESGDTVTITDAGLGRLGRVRCRGPRFARHAPRKCLPATGAPARLRLLASTALDGGARSGEERPEQVVTADGEDRLRVELHAFHRKVLVAQAHHDAVVGLRRDLEAVRHRRPVDHERVVSGDHERRTGHPHALRAARHRDRLSLQPDDRLRARAGVGQRLGQTCKKLPEVGTTLTVEGFYLGIYIKL